ncbi:hypothetical protein N657DRAFT_156730 [Parathielavia appendiculata]|uniref:Anaphase-promoting complex subunit 1 N-terminal domain-containing protein n=1 Tax=Parathielavia appendiculata TaxID=2587402 RepID=A0AAN6Z050_9PEZI|nr:hypothetical protein N657DRAFT_156730 [Parathielavia appendiculata]
MASITSLGVHQPVGLRHAIQEGILPRDPPASSYTWETIASSEDGRDYEDELLTTENCVIWSRGGIFRKSFKFDLEKEPVIQALLAYFPASADTPASVQHAADRRSRPTEKPALSRALVVFFKSQAHIHFLSGTSHVVHIPFEVESACAGPRGVVIQRKLRFDGTSVSLRMPKVPPASFVSSQPPPAHSRSHGHNLTEFSTEGLGNPKVLPLRLSFTLENMWQQPMEPGESHWPRLVCLTDPLLEIGLVVTEPEPELPKAGKSRKGSSAPSFLNRSEEILHIQTVKIPCITAAGSAELTVAVTVNREINMYTVWRLTYPKNEDPFLGPQKRRKPKPSRRRSSMAPGGATTPVQASARESFGAPLPMKKTRKTVKVENNNRILEKTLSSLVDPDKGNDATRRHSRRVSSLLARADLSASQDRATFGEQSIHGGHGGRRVDSHGSQRLRLSSGFGVPSFGATFNYNRIAHLPEVPVDNLLEELRAGSDFEGFHHIGLDDHDFDGLVHEMLFTKIQSINVDNANVRYSLSGKPARTQAKVFIIVGPPTATDDCGRSLLLVAIQDPVDKRLQLLTLHLEHLEDRTPMKSKTKHSGSLGSEDFIILPGEPRRVQSVVDSCKISDGHESIMVLSEDKSGGRELSLQSPWGKVTTVTLPLLLMKNVSSIEFSGSHGTIGTIREQLPLRFAMAGTHIDAICHPNVRGAVDLRDKEGRHHRIRLHLQPSSLQVGRVLDVCRSVLHASYADRIVAGWWHAMQWLQDTKSRGLAHPIADMEWSAAVILLLSSILALGHNSETSLRTLDSETSRPAAKNKWEAMQFHEAPNSAAYPSWMRSKTWQWLLDGGVFHPPKPQIEESWPSGDFISVHVTLAKQWMASPGGLSAFGFDGYLPTALNRPGESRNAAAWSILLALHLLAEEQKLNVLFPEDSSPGPSDLKTVLHQLSRWLGWKKYEAVYDLGMQAQSISAYELAPLPMAGPAEPPYYCVLTWIQGHLATGHGTEYPTLSDLYANATGDTAGGALRTQLWTGLTPRTIMFERLFARLGSATHRFKAVMAMHECGFTPQILETLPEAILTALQDVISISQSNPPPSWPEDLLAFVGRTDMSRVLKPTKTWRPRVSDASAPSHDAKWDVRMLCQHLDGLNDHVEDAGAAERQAVVHSLFREDRRLNEAQGLLSTVKHRIVRLNPRPEWTEAEYLEKQKELVTTVATSTLAIPAGRGLLHFALRYPLLTQKYQIPGFNLTCIVKPANNTVSVDKSMFPEEKINWAFFHQGVAGGLAISPHAKGIDTAWILYNKPGQDLSNRHAGFLLALGLNGHLKSVAKWVAFKYLTPKHTMTTIGLLLGLAASYIGTMDALMTRLLSVHVTRMLPRGAADLNLSTTTQTTGVMGIGLVYCNSQHRRMSEIMLSEIDHVGVEEEEEGSVRDESYRLAAGFALGFINLGKGGDLRGLRDMQLTEKLLTMATTTKRVELVHILDWSAAGAVVAIALIYMKSEDQIVARKIDVPDTLLQFDYVRPDILLLRTVAKNIILWNEVDPTFEWIRDGLPSEYRQRYQLTNVSKLQSRDLPFFSILAGLCFALALRFAGSTNVRVRDLLVHYLDQFIRIVRIPVSHYDSELARNNACMCMDVLALSCATVMAGTGDIVVLRRLRALHGRDDETTSYGSHLAAHLAIGALFLGSGTATFGTSNLAVASLLVAFYPLFPANVQDNRSHLQAFRHFWVLATEPRCLVTKDLVTGQPLTIPILIHLQPNSPSAVAAASQATAADNDDLTNRETITLRRQTPCLLPPLDDIARVETDAKSLGYWDIAIPFGQAPHLKEDFAKNQTVYLRRRPTDEGPFPATLRALAGGAGSGDIMLSGGSAGIGGGGLLLAGESITNTTAESAVRGEPLEWVFGLSSLADLSRAERDAVLDRFGTSGGGVGNGEGAGTAADARLVLRAGVDDEVGCWSRERLLGLQLLFEWAERRGLFIKGGGSGGSDVVAEKQGESGKAKRAKEKGKKKTASGRGKKVSLGVSKHDSRGGEQETEGHDVSAVEASWWLRDSAIEELKGRTWLAGRRG